MERAPWCVSGAEGINGIIGADAEWKADNRLALAVVRLNVALGFKEADE